ncbi:MAG: cadmium-translocating P-type ATPase [Propionibacteriaceae bacterium]|jgi:Cu+-exporting ATPase|nr:cadmium-translocating P-type ATPase [Propionibacteriaceae bacterium]
MAQTVELAITGMTCASCAARIQKKLNKLDGVTAEVNYATEKAAVSFDGVQVADLIAAVEAAGYGAALPKADDDPAAHAAQLRSRMVLAFILGVPVILLGMVPPLQFPGWQWVSLALTLVVYGWCGRGFHVAALTNLRHRATTMDTLISLGTSAALAWSVYALVFGDAGRIGFTHKFEFSLMRGMAETNIYLESVAGIICFLLLGRWIEARSKAQAGAAIRALLQLGANQATLLQGGIELIVPIAQLQVGDLFVVRPGEKIATDGEVVEGVSAVDNSLMTGESVPEDVQAGDHVIGAAINANGRLVVRATRVGSDTQLARMAKLVEQAQQGKAKVQRLADRISDVFVPVVLGIAAVTLAVWLLLGADLAFAAAAAVAVLIIACPCALGLATPTALLVGTGRGAQLGIVLKGAEMLERVRQVKTVVLDKTGTITTGQMTVSQLLPRPGVTPDELLRLAAGAESGSEHPIAKAITASYDGELPAVEAFANTPGLGIEAKVEGHKVLVGRASWVGAPVADTGATTVFVSRDGEYLGSIELADGLKPTSAEAIKRFRALGLDPVLLTGDNQATAESVAASVGITQVIAGVLPDGKVDAIKALQADGRQVAMVGDGVNDAAALAQADLGIALGTGTDAAIQASDLTLMRGDLLVAVDAIRLSRATLRTIRVNLFWAFAYNVAAIPLAALGFLNPMIAGAAMACSSVFVVLNSLRLRTFRAT